FYFFFFQAEDGIRDFHVTGVQTCALPIFEPRSGITQVEFFHDGTKVGEATFPLLETRKVYVDGKQEEELVELWLLRGTVPAISRSEERRVGKSVDVGGRRILKKTMWKERQ